MVETRQHPTVVTDESYERAFRLLRSYDLRRIFRIRVYGEIYNHPATANAILLVASVQRTC